MFVKIYKYKIRSGNLEKWRKNNDAANDVYRKHGAKKLERMMRKKGQTIEVLELGYYQSRSEFEMIAASVDKDKRIKVLFSEFKDLVVGDITEEDYETA